MLTTYLLNRTESKNLIPLLELDRTALAHEQEESVLCNLCCCL